MRKSWWFLFAAVLALGSLAAPPATPAATAQIGPSWSMAALKKQQEAAEYSLGTDQWKGLAAQKKQDAFNAYTRTTTTYNLLKYRIRMDRPLEADTIETHIYLAERFRYEADSRYQQGELKEALGDSHWGLGNATYIEEKYEESYYWFEKCCTDYPEASQRFASSIDYYQMAMDQCAGADAIMAKYVLP